MLVLPVDDTFCILRKGSAKLLHHLDEVRPTIKFTVEWEEGRGGLPVVARAFLGKYAVDKILEVL